MKHSVLMRLSLFLFFSFAGGQILSAQYYIIGRAIDEEERPYAFAKAELRGEGIFEQQTCSDLGVFRFEGLKSGSYEVVVITPYGIRRKKIELRGSIDVTLHIPRNIQIDEISVVAKRAGSNEPVTHTNINADQLSLKNVGQDMPMLLQDEPSVVATSDAGHGFGYTGLRVRGIDPTRINVTLNGIPVNDAESHNVFWVDLPDIAASTSTIQLQRGIGWSQPGTGDLGAGIHLNTLSFNHESYGGINLSYGSFNSMRASLHGGSGLVAGRFTFDGRGTYLRSDGYIDRAESNMYSVYGSAGYHHDDTNIRFVFALGDELTYQAWNGVPEQYIADPALRTFNSAGTEKSVTDPHDNEVDDYTQTYYQLHFDQALTPFARWTNALHYTRGKGFFEQYKAGQDLSDYGIDTTGRISDIIRRRWLDNHFYGFTSTLQIGRALERYLILGGGWNKYLGDHFGEVIWSAEDQFYFSPPQYYFNEAVKRDWNVFGRSNIKFTTKLSATVDLQGRWVKYQFEGPDENHAPAPQSVLHRFFNPKVGLQYQLSDNNSFYGLTGLMNKEPNRDDYVESSPQSRPRPERLWDTEIGFRHAGQLLRFTLTGFYMAYKDHLVPTGRLNDVGAYTRVNVDESYRTGIETSLNYQPVSRLTLGTNVTASANKIRSFDEYIDNWDTGMQEIIHHTDTDIAFSPALTGNIQAGYKIIDGAAHVILLDLTTRFVGKQYVDNTSNTGSQLDPYYVTDLGFHWQWKTLWADKFRLSIYARNILDQQYESNGWIYRFRSPSYNPVADDPYASVESGDTYHLKGYFPQAGRHFFISLQLGF